MDINEALKMLSADPKNLDKKLKQLQKSLGNDPEKLMQALNSPQAAKFISKLSGGDAQKLQNALSDAELINSLLTSPDALEKIKKMMEE